MSSQKANSSGVGSMFYDSQAGTVLGRNAASWAKILFFYAVYYTFLAGLFYGTLKLIENSRVEFTEGGDPLSTPYILSRTDQPGMAVFPHNGLDNNGLGIIKDKNNKLYKDYDAGDEDNQAFLLDETCYLPEVKKFIQNYKFSELQSFFGEGNVETVLPFVKNGSDGMAEFVDEKFKTETNLMDPKAVKPYIFITLNRVIDFNIRSAVTFEPSTYIDEKKKTRDAGIVGVPMQNKQWYDDENTKANTKAENTKANNDDSKLPLHPISGAAYFNCFPLNLKAKQGDAGGFLDEASKFKVNAVHPYITNENYAWSGYGKAEEISKRKPFAIMQVDRVEGDDGQKVTMAFSKDIPFRCNAIAKNIQYPYLEDSERGRETVDALKDGQGSYTFGFKSIEKTDDEAATSDEQVSAQPEPTDAPAKAPTKAPTEAPAAGSE